MKNLPKSVKKCNFAPNETVNVDIHTKVSEKNYGNESCVLEVPDKEINKLHRLGNDPEVNIGEFRQSVNNLVSSDFKEIEKIEKCDLTEIKLVSTSEENVNRVLEDVYETANPESIT